MIYRARHEARSARQVRGNIGKASQPSSSVCIGSFTTQIGLLWKRRRCATAPLSADDNTG
jgi:hypothetical protein